MIILKNFDLKTILKYFKVNESAISTVLGAVVLIVILFLGVNYFRGRGDSTLNPDNGLSTQTQGEYTVSAGESLWSIAEDKLGDGFRWQEIYDANGLTSTTLEIGQKLELPSDGTQIANVTESQPETYNVVAGDSLWNISVKIYGDGYKWVEIAKANNLSNPNIIHSGNVLTLPR